MIPINIVLEHISEMVAVLDAKGLIVYANPAIEQCLGSQIQPCVGQKYSEYIHPEDLPGILRCYQEVLNTPGHKITTHCAMRNGYHAWRSMQVTLVNALQQTGINGIILIAQDKTEFLQLESSEHEARKNMEALRLENDRLTAENARLAHVDSLSGLYQRTYFLQIAQKEFERVVRYGSPLSAIIIDIDHLKRINDVYGNAAGDLVISSVANACRTYLRTVDIIGHFHGTNFAILLPEADLIHARQTAERLRERILNLRISHENVAIKVTASFGIADCCGECSHLENLLENASQALKRAHQAGYNKVMA